MQLGSSPTTGTPRSTNGVTAAMTRSRFTTRLRDLADRQKRPAAAKRTEAVGWRRDVHAVTARLQDALCRMEIFAARNSG